MKQEMNPASFKFHIDAEIFYEDTDAGGVVYYANYLRYFERARMKFFEHHNISIIDLAKKDYLFMVTHAEIFYKAPARLGDILQIHTKISEASKVSCVFDYLIKRNADIITAGNTKLACVNGNGEIKKIDFIDMRKLIT